MRVLLTGGCGFIGSALTRHIIRTTDAEVINLDSMTYAAAPQALEECESSPRYTLVRGDITDGETVGQVFERYRPDGVIHLAAESHVDRSIDNPAAFINTNVVGTFTLLENARLHYQRLAHDERTAFRFHHVSTDEVFGSLNEGEPAFREDSAYSPRSPYSASKAASDHLVQAWHSSYGLPVVMTNCSNNYGPWQFPEKLIPAVIINALENRQLPVYGDGRNIRDWLYVDDHADALWQVFTSGRTGHSYNIGGNAERRNIEVVETVCRILDEVVPRDDNISYNSLIEFVADRPGHDHRYAMDSSKLQQELGWVPTTRFETGLRRTIDWYLRHRALWADNRPEQRFGIVGE